MRQMLIALQLAVLSIMAPVAHADTQENIQAWLNYDRPAEYEAIVTEVRPAMRDGVKLSCFLAVPGKNGQPVPGKFPGIISNVNPYTLLERFFINGIKKWATYGYQGLTCRVRGTGDSEGEYTYYSADTLHLEWSDSYDLVEWFAAHPGSNGRIGQEGASYGGLTAYQAAIGNPPHLVAIATEVAPGDFYLDHIYPGGIKTRRFTVDNWPVVTSMMNLPRFSPFRLWGEWIDHPTHDRYWDGLAVTPKLAAVKVPVLAISGWKDHLFRGGALHNYEMLVAQGHGDKTWLLAGPWKHELMDMPTGMVRAWFDYWLQEREVAPLPPARVVSCEGAGDGCAWRAFEQWPPSAASVIELALRQDGGLATDPGESGTRAYGQNQFSGFLWSEDTVAFTSSVLATDWVLAGDMEVELSARFSERDANIHAALFELRDGEERLIEQGWLKLSHRNSHVNPEPVNINETTRVSVPLWAVHQRIPAGSQVALKLSGGGVIDLVPVDTSVRTDIDTGKGGSTLRLTVLGTTE